MHYEDGSWFSGICFYLDAKHFIHKTNTMYQTKSPKHLVWRKEKMKALLRVVLQKEIKQDMVAKWKVLLLLYHWVKRFAIVSTARNLAVNYWLNL